MYECLLRMTAYVFQGRIFLDFVLLPFEFVSDFVLRISDFYLNTSVVLFNRFSVRIHCVSLHFVSRAHVSRQSFVNNRAGGTLRRWIFRRLRNWNWRRRNGFLFGWFWYRRSCRTWLKIFSGDFRVLGITRSRKFFRIFNCRKKFLSLGEYGHGVFVSHGQVCWRSRWFSWLRD